MHEYSLAHSLLESLLQHLKERSVDGRITAVHVRKGELLILSEESLAEAWRILSEETAVAGSDLRIEVVPVKVRCPSCGYEGPVVYVREEGWHFAVPLLACPTCDGRAEVIAGRDLAIVGLSVDEGSPRGSSDDR